MNLCGFNKMSWCEGVCYKISVEWELMKQTMTGLHKRFSGGWRIVPADKNDNHIVMNTLFDIDCLAQYEPSV